MHLFSPYTNSMYLKINSWLHIFDLPLEVTRCFNKTDLQNTEGAGILVQHTDVAALRQELSTLSTFLLYQPEHGEHHLPFTPQYLFRISRQNLESPS